MRRRHAQGGSNRARYPAHVRSGVGRGRPRFSRNARGREGGAGWIRANPITLRCRQRRSAGEAQSIAKAYRALLRGLSDAQERPADRSEACSRLNAAATLLDHEFLLADDLGPVLRLFLDEFLKTLRRIR